MSKAIFITGTDTDVGKTYVAIKLIHALKKSGKTVVGFKPIECGGREDSKALLAASSDPTLLLDAVNPVWSAEALAPAACSSLEKPISFEPILEAFEKLQSIHDFVVVEGAGGWLTPLDEKRTMADLAIALDLPVLIVSADRLGVLNHSLLTVAAVKSVGLRCSHLVLNQIPELTDQSSETNREMLRMLLPEIEILSTEEIDSFSHYGQEP